MLFNAIQNIYVKASNRDIPEILFCSIIPEVINPGFIQQVLVVLIGIGAKAFFDTVLNIYRNKNKKDGNR